MYKGTNKPRELVSLLLIIFHIYVQGRALNGENVVNTREKEESLGLLTGNLCALMET